MNIDMNTLVRAAIYVVIFGLILLGVTYLLPFLLPLISIAIILAIAYLIIRWFTTGRL